MGKFIFCIGNKAKTPYTFQSTGVSVYTMEELCYYLYHNIDTIEEDLSNWSLVSWIGAELGIKDRAEFLEQLMQRGAGIKDMAVSIFCSTDYYTEEEINHLIAEIDALYDMLPIERKKRHADMLMRFSKLREAGFEYRSLIDDKDFNLLSPVDQGSIYHNIAVINAKDGRFQTASKFFDRAYQKNHNRESLCQYLYSLKLSGDDEAFDKELAAFSDDVELVRRIENQFYFVEDNREYNAEYMSVLKLMEMSGRASDVDFWWLFDDTLSRIKKAYREN